MSSVVPERAWPKMKNFSRGKNCLISATSSGVMAGMASRFFFLASPFRSIRAALLKRENIILLSPCLSLTIQHHQSRQANQDSQDIHPRNFILENKYSNRDKY